MGSRGPLPSKSSTKAFREQLKGGKPASGPPAPAGAAPEPPGHLSATATALWWELAPRMHALGLLTPLDVACFAGYCWCCEVMEQAQSIIARDGLVIEDRRRGLIVHPAWRVWNQAAAMMVKIAGSFGLTPMARRRMGVADAPLAEGDALMEFLQ